ncbi:MAG: hypothetical protein KDA61_10925, partial [Planctomycetales bacterium]|nr:hypothetical protein [Planctomycetales bacterium]
MSTIGRPRRLLVWLTVAAGGAIVLCLPADGVADDQARKSRDDAIDFERQIAPLFGRLGCNTAACHGAFGGGKGGLQLSLFGYSAKMDYQAVNDRIDRSDPEASLLLRKPGGLEVHGGGVRFATDSAEYGDIKRWIEDGAPWNEGSGRVETLSVEPVQVVFSEAKSTQPLKVTAEFTDGATIAVTHLCQFTSRDEGVAGVDPSGQVVRLGDGDTSVIVSYGNAFAAVSVLAPFSRHSDPGPETARAEFNAIDARINEKLAILNIAASGQTTDEEFLRRVMLD